MNRQICLSAVTLLLAATAAHSDERDHPILKAVLAGKAPEAKDLKLRAAPAKPLSPLMANFSLPQWDKPKLLRLTDFGADAVVVVHLTQSGEIEAVTADVLRALKKRLGGGGLHIVTMLLDEGGGAAKVAAALKERAVDWPVALDDHAEFRELVLRENYYLPAFLVIGRDRKAQWISLDKLESSLATLCRTVEEELTRKPAKRPGGPVTYFPTAEPFAATPLAEADNGAVRFGTKPAMVISTQADDNGAHLKALGEIAKQFSDKIDVVAVVAGENVEQARAFAKGKPFRVLHEQSALPGCYGPSNRYRLALISPGGRVLKVILLNPSSDRYLPLYERYVRVLTTPDALPAEANAASCTNIALQANGGRVESAAKAVDGEADNLLDGKTGQVDWAADGKGKPEIVLSLRGGQPAKFDRVWLDAQSPIEDVELFAGDHPTKGYRSLGIFRLEDRRGLQAFTFVATTAKYLKVRLLSTYEANARFGLGEIGVEEAAGAPAAVAFKDGFRDEFADGRLTYWQQEDVGNIRPRPIWKIEKGKLVQPYSPLIRGFDHRCTALLHSYPVGGDYRFEATVAKPHGHNAGLVFAFRNWDNFDSLFLLEAQVLHGRREGNSIRLERRRNGKTQVLSIHGEWFDQAKPVRLEVTSRGPHLLVKANDRLIMAAASDAPVAPTRVGLCTAGASNSSFEAVRLTPLPKSSESPPELNPLSTAAGATIVWLSAQGDEKEPQAWASHLLRDAALSAPGAWVAPRTDHKPPEVVVAFRDARDVTLEEIGFTLPAGGDARDRAKKIEVLVTRDSPLLLERFRSVGVFDLEDRVTPQSFRLPRPEPARYVLIRLLENRGGEKFALARVSAKLGGAPTPAGAASTNRTEIETAFATAAPAKEREPNDSLDQATVLPDGKELDAAIQPGEVDLYRLPDRPAQKGRATLHLQLSALPWLRLHADLLDAPGKPLAPPLLRPQAGQIVRHFHSAPQPPQFVRVEMPNASLSVVLDMSGSMGGREKDVSTAIKSFFEGITASEQVQVLRFASEVTEMAPFTSDRKKLEPLTKQVRFTGATALYKGLLRALDDLSNRGGNRAILLLSDGMNTIPGEDFADLCRRLRRQTVPIYVIGVGQDLFEYDAASGNTCADLLRNLALMTGGRYYFAPTSTELAALYQQIAAEMRGATRYRLSARWEISERNVEVAAIRPDPINPQPFAGPLPPATPDVAGSLPPPKPAPYSPAAPPAPVEVAEIPPPPRVPMPSILPLPAPLDLAIEPLPPRPPAPAYPPLPTPLELAATPIVRSPPSPSRLDPLPEFGRVSVVYVPERAGAPLPASIRPALELILDSSGSMNEMVEGTPKYLAARRVMTDMLKVLPDDATVGLRVFGHMAFWDPNKEPKPEAGDKRYNTDSEIVVSIGPLTKDRRKGIQDWVDYLTPKGATPLVHSLVQAAKDFPADWKGPKTVVLVSDGIETCGGKLEDVEKSYRGVDVNLVIHVVGFDVKEAKEQEYLKSLARIGRGQYFNAANAQQLTDALNKALRSLAFQVHDNRGTILGAGTINGPALELEAGAYAVVIPGTTLKPVRVRLGGGKLTRLTLDAGGQLSAPASD